MRLHFLLLCFVISFSLSANARTWGTPLYDDDPNSDLNDEYVYGDFEPVDNYEDPDINIALSYDNESPLLNPIYDSYNLIVIVTKQAPVELKQTVRVYLRDEGLIYFWKTSTAREGYSTPVGHFNVTNFSSEHRSSIYNNAPMNWAVFFNGGIASHETGAIYKLGKPASAGCVRLEGQRARDLFHLVGQSGYGLVDKISKNGEYAKDLDNRIIQIRAYKTLYIVQ